MAPKYAKERSGRERRAKQGRKTDRRGRAVPVKVERRSGKERRVKERRSGRDRRTR
jgi:hypothetical protein